MEKHIFAVYYERSSGIAEHSHFTITDHDLIHRILNVLRLQKHEMLIFFDRSRNFEAELTAISRKALEFFVRSAKDNVVDSSAITVGLPLLKKEHFELALYSCVELGATTIVPFVSEKSQRKKLEKHDLERAEKIMVAAAEQSKFFSIPELHPLTMLNDLLSYKGEKIFFDAAGIAAPKLDRFLNVKELFLLFGPEGDLSEAEKIMLKEQGFAFCALTPTILRAHQAIAVGLGFWKILLTEK